MLKDTLVLKDILVLHTHLCYRHTCVKRHACRTDTLVLKTHLCYRHMCVKRQACVTDTLVLKYTLVLQTHLCYRYTWVTHVSVTHKLVLDIIDTFVLQTCLSHRHVCTHEQSLPSNADNLTGCFDTSCDNNNNYVS